MRGARRQESTASALVQKNAGSTHVTCPPNRIRSNGLTVHAGATRLGRHDLRTLGTPDATGTHKPIPHAALVEGLIESLAYRHLDVVQDEYAVTPDGMRLFGFLALNLDHDGVRLAIGLRNSHDKRFSLGLEAGYRVFVCDNVAFYGSFAALAKKHAKHLDLVAVVAMGVDRVQRQFQQMTAAIDAWRGFTLPDASAKAVIYDAFVAGALDAPKHLASQVHHHYFEPEYDAFRPRTLWSLSNAFTSALKGLDPVPQLKATAALAPFLAGYQ